MNVGRNGAQKCLIIGDPNRHQMMEKHMINIHIYIYTYTIYIYIYHIYTIYIYNIYIYICVCTIYICMLSICFVINVSGNDLALEAFTHIGSNHQNYNLFLIWLSYQPSVDHHTPHEKGPCLNVSPSVIFRHNRSSTGLRTCHYAFYQVYNELVYD